jgi:hypothetical protein
MADTRTGIERAAAKTRAQNHFQAAERRDEFVRTEIARERAATDAKTAKLRALRLAKEAEEREAAADTAEETPAPKKRKAKRIVV